MKRRLKALGCALLKSLHTITILAVLGFWLGFGGLFGVATAAGMISQIMK